MAIFDPVEQRMCIRIVYDGAGGTGKTTNLGALCNLFAVQNRTELFSPGELEGRTLYFDWVQIMAGLVCGYPLMCQVISVPGQTVLTPRRRHLLSTADVVVLVCDSSEHGVERAREGLRMIDELGGGEGRRLPLVVQANKQDQVRALSGKEILRQLGREDTPIVEAIATGGIGVIDTFVTAVRTVSKELTARSEAGTLNLAVGRAPGAVQLLERLEAQELDPEWAAELFLEEAQASLLVQGGFDVPPEVIESRRGTPPTLPQADVETGFVWPAHTGRLTLSTLQVEETTAALDDDGIVLAKLSGLLLSSSRADRFEDREDARQALVRAARERTQLEQLLAPGTVLVVQASRDGAYWLWRVRPELETLESAYAKTDGAREGYLRDYSVALVDLIRICLRNGYAATLSPSSFGYAEGHLRYLGELPAGGDLAMPLAVNAAMDAVARLGWDSQRFLASFEEELSHRLTGDEKALWVRQADDCASRA